MSTRPSHAFVGITSSSVFLPSAESTASRARIKCVQCITGRDLTRHKKKVKKPIPPDTEKESRPGSTFDVTPQPSIYRVESLDVGCSGAIRHAWFRGRYERLRTNEIRMQELQCQGAPNTGLPGGTRLLAGARTEPPSSTQGRLVRRR